MLVSAVPERGDAEGEGGGGPGGWRVQEAGGRGQQGGGGKEVSRKIRRNHIHWGESRFHLFSMTNGLVPLVANCRFLPQVTICGHVWQIVCLYAACRVVRVSWR